MSFEKSCEQLMVLDKNAMRGANAEVAKKEADSGGIGVLVTDTLFQEILNKGQWPDHFIADFEAWTDRPERMSVAKGIGETLREERATGRRTGSVIDADTTKVHRNLLNAVAAKDLTLLNRFKANAEAQRIKLQAAGGQLDVEGRVQQLKRFVDACYTQDAPKRRARIVAELDDVGGKPLSVLAGEVLDSKTPEIFVKTLVGAGYDADIALALLSQPSFTAVWRATLEAYSLILWARGLHVEDLNQEKQFNQLLDLEYVSVSLCCETLHTNETIMQRLEAGIREHCKQLWK